MGSVLLTHGIGFFKGIMRSLIRGKRCLKEISRGLLTVGVLLSNVGVLFGLFFAR